MPLYRFVSLGSDFDPAGAIEHRLHSDAPAVTRALSDQFPAGCEVWQGLRFVGRFYRAAPQAPSGFP